ncbi:MAG: cellulase family glycosylhydrolase [Segetibacter sp.]|nr:cellulase family glycosylhydrolase [Segetibacter sp.]
MNRRDFVNFFLVVPPLLAERQSPVIKIKPGSGNSASFQKSFVRISKKNPFYFELSNGDPYIVTGPCLAGAADMETMHSYLKKLSENGGNFARVWVCNRLFEVEEKYGEYSEEKAKNVDKLLEWAHKYNLKLKLCLDNTRQIIPDQKAWFNKPQYHVDNGGPFKNVDEYINTEKGRNAFLNRIEYFRKRYGNHPAVFGWELWNEMNGIMCKGLREWNDYMLPEVHKRFPQNLVLQSLGSFDMESRRPDYSYINKLPSNDVAQIHRYIDAGAKLDVCTAPMDVLSADAINELRSYHIHKPMLLAEVGAVLPNHTGPSELYPLDKEGALMHDMLFAPFFAGAAGGGNSWHWDHYIDKNNLWYHYARFNESVKGINPIAEGFMPTTMYHNRLRIYALVGNKTILAWCRDIKNDWKSEFKDSKKPEEIRNEKIDLGSFVSTTNIRKVSVDDPWRNQWEAASKDSVVALPTFKRSIVIKIEK